jgi:hypothetical protein
MTPEETLYLALSTDGSIISLVGNKIFVDDIEPGTERPCIVYQRQGTDPQIDIHGIQYASFVNIAVVVHSDNRIEADSISLSINSALQTVKFWQTNLESGFEPEIDATSSASQFTMFYTV